MTPAPPQKWLQTALKWLAALAVAGSLAAAAVLIRPAPAMQESEIFIPVRFGKTPAGLTLSEPPIKGLEVLIRGPQKRIDNLALQELHYEFDLSREEVGLKSIAVIPERIPLPKEIAVIQVNPATVIVRIENEITKHTPVEVSLTGKPASGFKVADALSQPPAVFLRGPESVLQPIQTIVTKPVDVTELADKVKKEIVLDLPPGITVIYPSGIMRADIYIDPKVVVKKLEGLPVTGRNSEFQFKINPPQIEIELKGPMVAVEKLDTAKEVAVYVDLKGLKPGIYPRRAAIALPPDVTLVGVKPEIFTVEIDNKPFAAKQNAEPKAKSTTK